MSDIVKKGFFRRCLYRATGAYLLEQHIQMLEQQVKTQQMQLAQMEKEGEERKAQDAQQQQFNTASQERLDHLELHAAAQDEHRNNIDAQLQQTAGQTNDLQRRMEWAEDGMREAGLLLPSELQLFNKKSYSQAGEDAILMYIFVMLGVPLSQCNYLDLGANHPCDMSNTWFFYQQGATGILVDYRQETGCIDQDLPAFVVARNGAPVGKIANGDSVILFNFRGDRAQEISLAFDRKEFDHFDRGDYTGVHFAGMLQGIK